jgi:hypothetical protein
MATAARVFGSQCVCRLMLTATHLDASTSAVRQLGLPGICRLRRAVCSLSHRRCKVVAPDRAKQRGAVQGGQAGCQRALVPRARRQPEAHRLCAELALRRRPPRPRQARQAVRFVSCLLDLVLAQMGRLHGLACAAAWHWACPSGRSNVRTRDVSPSNISRLPDTAALETAVLACVPCCQARREASNGFICLLCRQRNKGGAGGGGGGDDDDDDE